MKRRLRMLRSNNGVAPVYGQTANWVSSPERLLPPGFSLTRASTGRYYDSAGLLQTAAVDEARGTYRYNGSAWVFDGTIVEAAATNSCLQSEALTTAPWTSTLGAGSAKNAVGRNGNSNQAWTLVDDSAVSFLSTNQNITVPVDSNTHALKVWIRKTSGGTSPTFGINSAISGGVTVSQTIRLNTDTGFIGFGSAAVTDEGSWWGVAWTLTNNSSASNTTLNISLFPATAANGSYSDVATATGSAVVDGIQVQLNSSAVGSYIPTAAAAVTRSADVLTALTSGLLVNAQGFAAIGFRTIATTAGFSSLVSSFNGSGGIPLLYDAVQAKAALFDGAVRNGPSATVVPGVAQKWASSWGEANAAVGVNGSVTSGLTFDSSMDFGATLRIGSDVSATGQNFSMVLQSLRLGIRAATNVELGSWTV